MSLAAETREAVRAEPFLLEALRAGVVNYAAAARWLDVSDDYDAVSTALRRFAGDLPDRAPQHCDVRVSMHSGIAKTQEDGLLRVGDETYGGNSGSLTGIIASGDVSPRALAFTLAVLAAHEIEPAAAGAGVDSLVILVDRAAGPSALRLVEGALARVPNSGV